MALSMARSLRMQATALIEDLMDGYGASRWARLGKARGESRSPPPAYIGVLFPKRCQPEGRP